MSNNYEINVSGLLCYHHSMRPIYFILFLPLYVYAAHVTHYTALKPACYGHHAIIRSFTLDGERKQLVVDTDTLQTSIQDIVLTIGHPCGSSRYTHLLDKAATAPYPLTNDGITHQRAAAPTLTTDLCPSSKIGFERRLYESLIRHFKQPVPVTLFITKRWIDRHPAAFEQFQTWQRSRQLAITWGNHTAYHHYHPSKPLRENFVLSPGENLTQDVLNLEIALIERGITPSVFFRFPGLVSDRQSIETIRTLGLIPIGSDAWIAKGQKQKPGSIILVHGNKNEPKGVNMLLRMIKNKNIQKLSPLLP